MGGARPSNTMFFYALAAIAVVLVWLGRRRLTLFDIAVLALTFAGGVNAIRGIVWFALACMVFVPVAIGHKLESKKPGRAATRTERRDRRRASPSRCSPSRARSSLRDETWFEEYWPREAVEAVRARARARRPRLRSDRFSDWMLFKIPELRGRMAYDVRFELYDDEFFDELQDYNFEDGAELEVVRRRLPHRHRRRDAAGRTPRTSSPSRARA